MRAIGEVEFDVEDVVDYTERNFARKFASQKKRTNSWKDKIDYDIDVKIKKYNKKNYSLSHMPIMKEN